MTPFTSVTAQVDLAAQHLEEENQNALDQINAESSRVKSSILKQETSPVIYHWYRKILGRDPSQAEYDRWIDHVTSHMAQDTGSFFSPASGGGQVGDIPAWLTDLKAELITSVELAARAAEVSAIKARVTAGLQHYLTRNSAEKLALETGLGIEPNLITDDTRITSNDADALLSWLNRQSLHFGQSAYIALEAMLQQEGYQKNVCSTEGQTPQNSLCYTNGIKTFSRIQLAADLILTDILTGTLTPLESGDLVLSLYAMKRFAARQGFETSALSLDYDALKTMYAACATALNANCPKSDRYGSFLY